VDVIYHSDSLFSAVTSAMVRMGRLEEWLDATARSATPAVCFSSCFPFVDQIGYVVPPRTMWPPTSASLKAAHVRWKSARFIPLAMVQSMLAGDRLDENRWSVDGPSGCLMPVGKQGPFRTSVRWGAAVDRLSGASERHSTACIEFRPGAGLWTVIGFAGEAARDQWLDTIKAAFRLLADTGFGGERSRGWGRSEAPEFVDGELPGMIIGEPAPEKAEFKAPPVIEPLVMAEATAEESPQAPPVQEPTDDPPPFPPAEPPADDPPEQEPPLPEEEPGLPEPEPLPDSISADTEPAEAPEPDPVPEASADEGPAIEVTPVASVAPAAPKPRASGQSHWMLSLFTPAAADTVDWARGSYTLLSRGGRVDSPAGSGELKKQIQMIAEGSVLIAESAPCGAAPDVAPEGFAHPVFRAGFALAIPLPEGN
jgi:CRISPR/Cas system CSM-associated protein Csm4 (group 5 of RAMP superfamily)